MEKMKMNFGIGFVLLMLLAGFAAAAATSTTGPALQVTDHATVPATLYPGTNGQLQITIMNAGTDTATGISVQSTVQGSTTSAYPGDIGAGATSSVSVPFSVPQDFQSGVMIVYLNIYYQSTSASSTQTSSSNSGVTYKSTQVSIPLEISQHQSLVVNTVSVRPLAITPGDSFTAQLELVNTGGTTNNILITAPSGSSFALQGTTQQTVDSVPYGENTTVNVVISTSSSTASGKYTVPLTVTYQDALQNTVTQTAYVGPVTVYGSSSQFKVSLVPDAPVEVGSQAQFELTLENIGGSATPAFVDFNASSVFTPLGSARIYFDPIAAGQKATTTVTLGVSATASAGYYTIPITITGNGNTYVQNVGVVVTATPDLTITSQVSQAASTASGTSGSAGSTGTGTGGQTLTISIANTGNTAIRSVYASAASSNGVRVIGTSDKFIGTLNVDDFATFQVNVMETGSAGNVGSTGTGAAASQNTGASAATLPVTITFKDSDNQAHTITKNVDLQSASAAGFAGASGSFAGRRNAGGLFGLGLIPSIILVIVVLGILVYGYKYWKHEKIYFPAIKIPFIGGKKKQ